MYRDLFARAFREHVKLQLRAEDHENYLELFADNKQLDLLNSQDWQVIYGSRGTGKTILLGALAEANRNDVRNSRVLSVKIAANDFVASPVGDPPDDKTRALGFFQTFLERLADELLQAATRLLDNPSFMGKLKGDRRRREDRIINAAVDMIFLSQEGIPIAAFSDQTLSNQTRTRDAQEQGLGLGFGVTTNVSGVHSGLELSGKKSRKRETVTSSERRRNSRPVPRPALIRDRLLELLQELGVRHLNILIDEWPMLGSPTTGVQPEFGELLKRTFGGAGAISVKIAAERYQTCLSVRRQGGELRGLELGADIFEATNLDHALLSDEELLQFYEHLMFKRLRHCEPELDIFDPDGDGQPDEQFVLSMFKDKRAFRELVKGAMGVPRDFLQIFNEVVRKSNFTVAEKFTAPLVQRCMRETAGRKQQTIAHDSEAGKILAGCVLPLFETTRSRVFFLNKVDREMVQAAIEELLAVHLIQQYPPNRLRADVRGSHDAFLLDYCTYLDWQRSLEYRLQHPLPTEPVMPDVQYLDVKKVCLDVSAVAEKRIVCLHCATRFSENARSFRMKGLCPECYETALDRRPRRETDS